MKIIKIILSLVFMITLISFLGMSDFIFSLESQKYLKALEEKNLDKLPYDEFTRMMSEDYVKRLDGIIPASDIREAFKKAFPQERFRKEIIAKIIPEVIWFIKGENDKIEQPVLIFKDFKTSFIQFFKENEDRTTSPADKEAIRKVINDIFSYPDEIGHSESLAVILSPDDIEHFEEMRASYGEFKKKFIRTVVIAVVLLVLLLFTPQTFGISLIVSGGLSLIGTIITKLFFNGFVSRILKGVSSQPGMEDFTRGIVSITVGSVVNLLLIESIIILIIGFVIHKITRRAE